MTDEDWYMVLFLLVMLFITLGNIYLQRRNAPYPGLPKYRNDEREG